MNDHYHFRDLLQSRDATAVASALEPFPFDRTRELFDNGMLSSLDCTSAGLRPEPVERVIGEQLSKVNANQSLRQLTQYQMVLLRRLSEYLTLILDPGLFEEYKSNTVLEFLMDDVVDRHLFDVERSSDWLDESYQSLADYIYGPWLETYAYKNGVKDLLGDLADLIDTSPLIHAYLSVATGRQATIPQPTTTNDYYLHTLDSLMNHDIDALLQCLDRVPISWVESRYEAMRTYLFDETPNLVSRIDLLQHSPTSDIPSFDVFNNGNTWDQLVKYHTLDPEAIYQRLVRILNAYASDDMQREVDVEDLGDRIPRYFQSGQPAKRLEDITRLSQ